MNETPKANENHDSADHSETSEVRRADHVMLLPLIRLFYPDPDPTEPYPGEVADIDGYVVAPDRTVTLAVTIQTAEGLDMMDSVWDVLRRKGVGLRRMLVIDDCGRTVSVMTLTMDVPKDLLKLLRSLLVVPVRTHDGFAEVHFFATRDEASALERSVEVGRHPVSTPSVVLLPPAKDTGPMQPEDWAMLGLLSAVGAFNGAEGPDPKLFADLLGIDPETFAEQAYAIERSMSGLVSDIFAPSAARSNPEGAAA